MPSFLCLWVLTRQAHKELQNFCVPELEAALDILQVRQSSKSQVQAWPGPDWHNVEVGGAAAGQVDSAGAVALGSECQPCEVTGGMSPHLVTDAAVAPDYGFNAGPIGSIHLLYTACFEDETTVLRALQRCVLLTAIIEVRWPQSLQLKSPLIGTSF